MRLSNVAIATALLAAGSLAAQVTVSKAAASSKSGAKSTAHSKSTRHHASTSTASAKSTAPAKSTTSKSSVTVASTTSKGTGSKAGSKTKKPAVVVARRSMQQAPTPDRYREIQQALGEKGYFAGQPDGTWGAESVDALKRFQRDQNLTEDGKIGALSLIAMGLGPKRTAPVETSVAVEAAPAEKQLDKQLDKPSH